MDAEEELGEGGAEKYPYGEYVGSRDENLDRHGMGSALLPNGDIYEGNYYHGKRHGKGMYCFRNGARYKGDWRKGLKHGYGEMIYPDGTKYAGHWRKDLKNGVGTYYYANGDYYDGNWFKGWRHGLGTYIYASENVSHYGVWINGRMTGPGILSYPCEIRYHGNFERNLPKGSGCFAFGNKCIQQGYYLNIRDPKFDYVGAQELAIDKGKQEDIAKEQEEDRSNPKGIVPIWRARKVLPFKPEYLPQPPSAVPVKESLDSLIDVDILDYLKQQYSAHYGQMGEEAEDEDDGEEYLRNESDVIQAKREPSFISN